MAVPSAAIESSTTGTGTVSAVTTAVRRGGAGAGRLRISDQTNSPAATSTPMAISRVGSEIVDVVMAGGTAGTGVTVEVGVGDGVGEGVGVGVERRGRARRLGGRGVGSR